MKKETKHRALNQPKKLQVYSWFIHNKEVDLALRVDRLERRVAVLERLLAIDAIEEAV